jgi:hypothetical protein
LQSSFASTYGFLSEATQQTCHATVQILVDEELYDAMRSGTMKSSRLAEANCRA